ncbi:hypothetical protein [Salinibacterium sp. ZJ450]|uniref:hypothetical protein n=1 Tax=Salinibacterium sp. ZJ450 TaxID=2708338 RepID=UPI001422EED6|nr:hypothetical protein [Salinibacterium sp. ZJ450]
MTDEPTQENTEELLSRLSLIEDQPLEARAAAFLQLHDELKAALDSADSLRADSLRADSTNRDTARLHG